ncbi:MAG: dimethylargininase [Candidatus Schekmanbacteria bacterium]|nr:dimethylargininase [Candidatus Schekmanbacteria bacterium]
MISSPVPGRRALVRAVPGSFTCALQSRPTALNPELARSQHATYVAALEGAGYRVTLLAADESCPDCCFIEDTAVILDGVTLITRPGAPSRLPETPAVAAALSQEQPVVYMQAPATMDGGDVLRVGRWLFAGRTARTNAAGIDRLSAVAAEVGLEVVPVAVAGALHLKSLCTLAAPELIVAVAHRIDLATFRARGLRVLETDELAGGNVLALGEVTLVSADSPLTASALAADGVSVRSIAISEFHRADGALTCLSLRFGAPG